MSAIVVAVQRDPRYWSWFVETVHAKLGLLGGVLGIIGRSGVLPPQWGQLCRDLAELSLFGGLHLASTAQPPRVQATPEQRAQLDAAARATAPFDPERTAEVRPRTLDDTPTLRKPTT